DQLEKSAAVELFESGMVPHVVRCVRSMCQRHPSSTRAYDSLPCEEGEPCQQADSERLVVEPVSGVCLETPREGGAPRDLHTEARAGRELAVAVVTREARDGDERPNVRHRCRHD